MDGKEPHVPEPVLGPDEEGEVPLAPHALPTDDKPAWVKEQPNSGTDDPGPPDRHGGVGRPSH